MKQEICKSDECSNLTKWIAGGAAALALAIIFAKNFASIRRYIKIEMM